MNRIGFVIAVLIGCAALLLILNNLLEDKTSLPGNLVWWGSWVVAICALLYALTGPVPQSRVPDEISNPQRFNDKGD